MARLSPPPVLALRLASLPPRIASLAGLLEEGGLWTSAPFSTGLRNQGLITLIKNPLVKVGLQQKLQKVLKGRTKYAAIGGALSVGAEGASALVRHAEGPQNM